MLFLDPIYSNVIGTTYVLKDNLEKGPFDSEKIQMVLGEVAIILSRAELENLVVIINSAKAGCNCKNCRCKILKQIKGNTNYVEFVFKSTENNLSNLEDLVKGTLFELQIASVLSFNNIE
ncbi:hypothetical protein PK35_14365 [Tamlana nanhaiensis]|uniref:Uncharacterized protein n=1 Tax=Neotamlana nanhaiensis TaxID=1382798 RepID=A0A0D7VYR1_9FLAO|nr:hypothetical protein [Tamlana nanhaiensis]KJD31583.1 hypothetical protein PK35_14365 [Tamlana nanhaiensis]